MRTLGWIGLVLCSCAKTEEHVEWRAEGWGLLSGIEDKKSGWVHLKDAAAYDEFRKTHARVVGRDQRDAHSEPLPDFDFTAQELVIVWGGTMSRTLDIVRVRAGIVEVRETKPSYDEDAVARMLGVGTYQTLSLPRTGKPIEVRWVR